MASIRHQKKVFKKYASVQQISFHTAGQSYTVLYSSRVNVRIKDVEQRNFALQPLITYPRPHFVSSFIYIARNQKYLKVPIVLPQCCNYPCPSHLLLLPPFEKAYYSFRLTIYSKSYNTYILCSHSKQFLTYFIVNCTEAVLLCELTVKETS